MRRERGVDGNCNWPCCKRKATRSVDGLGYCEEHFQRVGSNRKWLIEEFRGEP